MILYPFPGFLSIKNLPSYWLNDTSLKFGYFFRTVRPSAEPTPMWKIWNLCRR